MGRYVFKTFLPSDFTSLSYLCHVCHLLIPFHLFSTPVCATGEVREQRKAIRGTLRIYIKQYMAVCVGCRMQCQLLVCRLHRAGHACLTPLVPHGAARCCSDVLGSLEHPSSLCRPCPGCLRHPVFPTFVHAEQGISSSLPDSVVVPRLPKPSQTSFPPRPSLPVASQHFHKPLCDFVPECNSVLASLSPCWTVYCFPCMLVTLVSSTVRGSKCALNKKLQMRDLKSLG